MTTTGALRRTSLMALATAALAGALLGPLAPGAHAATTFTPSTGNDETGFRIQVTDDCAAGSIESNYYFSGPGSDVLGLGEGFVGTDGTPASGGFDVANVSIANLRTATATFGVAPFPKTYDLIRLCIDAVGTVQPFQVVGSLTITGTGTTENTWTASGSGGGTVTTTSTSTTTATSDTTTSTSSTTTGTTTTGTTTTTTTPRSTTTTTTSLGSATTTTSTSTTASGTSTSRATVTPTSTSSTARRLADTGGDATLLAVVAAGLVILGLALVAVARRRGPQAGTHR